MTLNIIAKHPSCHHLKHLLIYHLKENHHHPSPMGCRQQVGRAKQLLCRIWEKMGNIYTFTFSVQNSQFQWMLEKKYRKNTQERLSLSINMTRFLRIILCLSLSDIFSPKSIDFSSYLW